MQKKFLSNSFGFFESIPLVENHPIAFYDDIAQDRIELCGKKIVHTAEEARRFFEDISSLFTIGIGGPYTTFRMAEKFTNLGGYLLQRSVQGQ